MKFPLSSGASVSPAVTLRSVCNRFSHRFPKWAQWGIGLPIIRATKYWKRVLFIRPREDQSISTAPQASPKAETFTGLLELQCRENHSVGKLTFNASRPKRQKDPTFQQEVGSIGAFPFTREQGSLLPHTLADGILAWLVGGAHTSSPAVSWDL